MEDDSPRPDAQALSRLLAAAFFEELSQEAARLGLCIEPSRLHDLSRSWLLGPDSKPLARAEWVSEAAADYQDEYRRFELYDYLHLVARDLRKRKGQFTTPQPIVRSILDSIGYQASRKVLARKLIDPACGSGAFLVEATRRYLGALRRAAVPQAEWYPRLREQLVGIDIDPMACLYARFNLGMLLTSALLFWMNAHPEHLPPLFHVHVGDTLEVLASQIGEELPLYDQPRWPLYQGFDYVVGNPPYLKIARLSSTLRNAFDASIYGHPNAYGLFVHAGIEMLKSDGHLGFIVPRSMLSGLYFHKLRSFIRDRTDLNELTLIADRRRVFDGVLQGTMIMVVQRRFGDALPSGKSSRKPVKVAVVQDVEELKRGSVRHVHVSGTRLARRLNGTNIWFVADRYGTYSILDKLFNGQPLLGSHAVGCAAKTGPIVWNRLKGLLRNHDGRDARPLVWATDVGRFQFDFASVGETRPAYLKLTERTRGLLTSGSSLLVQRVTADEQPHRIVACIPSGLLANHDRYFVENHLNVLQAVPEAPKLDLYYVLGVLSSSVVEFLFRAMNGNTQVSATELNILPIPRGAHEAEIADLARALQEKRPGNGRVELESELDDRVSRAYGLSSRNLAYVKRRLTEAREA